MLKRLNPEISLGFLLAAVFWAGVLGWQASYSFTEIEKQECQQAAQKAGHKTEECKSLWEKTTSDPVALFTFVLAVSTIGLWVATVFLYRAGERQIGIAKRAADIAETSLVATQRAFVRVLNFPWLWRPDTDRPGKYFYDITPVVENDGNTPTVDMRIVVSSQLRDTPLPDDFEFSYDGIEPALSLIGSHQSIGAHRAIILDDDLLLVQQGKKFFYIWGTITYRDVFENTAQHTTKFCTEINRVMGNPLDPRDPSNPKGTTVEIAFRIHPKHQKTD